MIGKARNKRILIVEDEVRIALSLRRALQHPLGGGHIVEISPNAKAALVRIQHEPFDMLITDLKMPGMSGLELIQSVREVNPEMRAILITAFNSTNVENRAHRLDATYIKKPFNLPEFITVVQDMLDNDPQMVVFSGKKLEPMSDTPDLEQKH